jgi:hypothetical protein
MAKAKAAEEKISQKKMVWAAIEAKGWDAKNAELQDYIREQFDTELAPNVISNYKSIIKRESGKPTGGKRGRKATPQFSDLETICGLVNRLGVDKVRQLVDMAGVFA